MKIRLSRSEAGERSLCIVHPLARASSGVAAAFAAAAFAGFLFGPLADARVATLTGGRDAMTRGAEAVTVAVVARAVPR